MEPQAVLGGFKIQSACSGGHVIFWLPELLYHVLPETLVARQHRDTIRPSTNGMDSGENGKVQ